MFIKAMHALHDTHGRTHDYLRISLTDRCNLRCRYCMPPEGIETKPRAEVLTFDEIETLARIFVDLGVRKIRLTGGEPLIRRGVENLCVRLARLPGLQALGLTTNGVLLEKKARSLKEAGVELLNVSLDTLQPEKFSRITLRTEFESVLRGIEVALSTGFASLKTNTVVMKGFNDDELIDFVEFAGLTGVSVRFIEYMPLFGNGWREATFVSFREMKNVIETRYTLTPLFHGSETAGPAKEYRVEGIDATIGFITTMSEHFCGSCSRLRLTSDGMIRNCLFAREELNLRDILRSGGNVSEIITAIRTCVLAKWEKHPEADELSQTTGRAMTLIGG